MSKDRWGTNIIVFQNCTMHGRILLKRGPPHSFYSANLRSHCSNFYIASGKLKIVGLIEPLKWFVHSKVIYCPQRYYIRPSTVFAQSLLFFIFFHFLFFYIIHWWNINSSKNEKRWIRNFMWIFTFSITWI